MDLRSMTEKLEPSNKLAYKTYGELFEDFKQIVINCKIFNPPNTEPVWYVEVLDRAWRAEWEKASKMSYTTKRSLGSFLKNLMAEGAYVLSYLVAFLKHPADIDAAERSPSSPRYASLPRDRKSVV